MSQVTQPRVSLPIHVRSHRTGGLGAVLIAAIAAVAAAVALVLALGKGPARGWARRPIAASVGGGSARGSTAVDETRVAASIAAAPQQALSGPDESRTAASISGR